MFKSSNNPSHKPTVSMDHNSIISDTSEYVTVQNNLHMKNCNDKTFKIVGLNLM